MAFGDAGRLAMRAELISLGFHVLMLWSVVGAMTRVDASDRWYVLGPLATAGLLLGFVLARSTVQDLLAHSLAVWMGALSALVFAGTRAQPASGSITERLAVYRDLVSTVVDSLLGADTDPTAGQQGLVVLGITSWLLAYSSAWVVYRRRWFAAGVGVPAAILLTSLRIDDRSGGWQLAVFLIGAIGLGARDAYSANLERWSRRLMPASPRLATGFMRAALPIAVVTVLLATTLNPAIQETANGNYRDRVSETWSRVNQSIRDVLGIETEAPGNYSTFPDEWTMGNDLDLGNDVVAYVTSDTPHYLAARRYNVYTGSGWSSDVESTFVLESDEPGRDVTHVTFPQGRRVQLSADVSGERQPVTAAIRVEQPTDGLLFTIETYSAAVRDVTAIMSWTQIDALTVDVNSVDFGDVPIDLQGVITTLRGQSFETNEDGQITFADPAVETKLADVRDQLAAYPVTVELIVDSEGELNVRFTGRVPNYDDIEVVFASGDLVAGQSYGVIGQRSTATAGDLASAGQDYPGWVERRYLQAPSSVTNRTVELAREVAAGAAGDDPYHQALAIQNYLRANLTYELNSPPPPNGQDWVDYVLFDRQAGRCEQYAAAMTVMVRSLGIPARIVAGYNTTGETNAADDFVYRENQAHTWVEVFFPGYGWIPFEPTVTLDPFAIGADGTEPASNEQEPTAVAEPDSSPEPGASPTAEAEASPVPPLLTANDDASDNFRYFVLFLFAVGMTLLVGIGAYLLVSWRLGLGGLGPAAGLFARVQKVGRWFGLEPTDATTPAEYARAFSRAVPGSDGAVRSITEAYYAERFNPASPDPPSLVAAETGWRQLRRNLLRWRVRRPKSG